MTESARRLSALAARDMVIVVMVAALWWATLQQPSAPADGVVVALQIVTGLATLVVGYLLHEWGHWLGAMLMRARVEYPATVMESAFLFRFDGGRNTRAQFYGMALGGFVSSFVTVVAFFGVLPWELLASKIALGLTVLGVIATLVIEVPEFVGVVRGGPIPNGAAFVDGRNH